MRTMTHRLARLTLLSCAAAFLASALVGTAGAQFISNPKSSAAQNNDRGAANNNPSTPTPGTPGNNGNTGNVPAFQFPGTNLPPGMQSLTPDQVRSIMMYRALQSRGGTSGQVRTGVPQFIPFAPLGFYNPQATGAVDPQQQQADAKKQSARERRIAARKAAEEKKRAAREAAKAKAEAKKKN
jgi:hypothetical protein